MDKKAIIQELRTWHDAILSAQALPFLEPLGLTMRFDADVFDEDERQDTGCIALYKGGSVFEKEILYWINYKAIADYFIREDDCSQEACKEQMHINLFHVIGSALVEMFSNLYGQGDETFDASVDDLPESPLRSLLQDDGDPKQLSALSEEFVACHQDNRAEDSSLYLLHAVHRTKTGRRSRPSCHYGRRMRSDRGLHDSDGQPRDVPPPRPEPDAFGITAAGGRKIRRHDTAKAGTLLRR